MTDEERIPWEREGTFFTRLWDTVSAATIDPMGTFGKLAVPGPPSKALSLMLVTTAIGYWPYLACLPCAGLIPLVVLSGIRGTALASAIPSWAQNLGLGMVCGTLAGLPVLILLFSLSVDFLHGLVFYVLARLFQGKGSLASSMRTGMYTSVIRFWLWPILLVGIVPMIGTILQILGRLILVFWSGFAFYGAATKIHGLDQNRSIAVAVLTPLITLGLCGGVWGAVALAIWAMIAGGLHSLPAWFPQVWQP